MSVEIREIRVGGRIRPFLDVVEGIYAGDPNYVRPLNFDLSSRLSRANPFFDHGEATYFTAYRNGQCVGRCSAQIDHSHLELHRDGAGFFGFFDTVDDAEVAAALLDAARKWLKERGMQSIRGPFSLSINEETGCLIEGFDTPPMILMPHHRAYQGGLIEKAGFAKAKDVFAWKYKVGEVSKRVRQAHDQIAAMPEVTCRPMDPAFVERDARLLVDIHNDAWSETWGFVPFADREVAKFAADLKLLLDPSITAIVSIDGKPAATALALPNLNAALKGLHGKLSPLKAAKLFYRLKVQGVSSARLCLLGIRKEYRNKRKYAALSAFLYARLNDAAHRKGYELGELGWTLEDNGPVNAGIRMMGGTIYKKYRVYEAAL